MKQYIVTNTDKEEDTTLDIPESHKSIVRERIEKYGSNKGNYMTRKGLNDKIKYNH